MSQRAWILVVICIAFLWTKEIHASENGDEFPPKPPVPYLSPEESASKFVLPEGYRMELVLDETTIKEPVLCVFDGNGRMYVSEFRSYMQDIDGTNELTSVGCVSRHESTKGDGHFDKHTVYADKLMLPRMVLPLDDRILINETNTMDINVYRDTNGDGVADKKELWFEGGPRGGNLEHQQSGLIWGLDNWMYQAANAFRLRYTGKEVIQEKTPGNGGQWGLAQDDYGKIWFSNAGGEKGFVNFQVPIVYGGMELPNQFEPGFLEVYPLVGLADVQGGHSRHRPPPDNTLNHMTASCGQQIVRVDRVPEDLRGDALICEPVGRLIRRGKIENHDGITYVKNAYNKKEFILSNDPNFRPINIANGPDGCLYIVDMYRGIIQEGNWVREGSYLRKVVKQYNLDKNAGRGRIWRLVHKDFQPGPQPRMLDETPAQLVSHLEHPNGWWRDTAQKLLVLKGDKSVVPDLIRMAHSSPSPLGRIHALWTLEGLDALDSSTILDLMKDSTPEVRGSAIRASESLLKKKDDPQITAQIHSLSADPDSRVIEQTVMTAKLLKWPDLLKFSQTVMSSTSFDGVKVVVSKLLHDGGEFDKKRFNKGEIGRLEHGQTVFRELCYACHGFDGRGMPRDAAPTGIALGAHGNATTIAPPLAGSSTVRDRDSILRVLMNGLEGPISGKTYDAQMVSMGTNDDVWIADVASYVRNSFGNNGSMVHWTDAARIRNASHERSKPWTREELETLQPKSLANASGNWVATASHNPDKAKLAVDNKLETRWEAGAEQGPGMWYQIELPEPAEINAVIFDQGKSVNDYPRTYKFEISNDGKLFSRVAEGRGTPGMTEIEFSPLKTKYLRITTTGAQKGSNWSIHEVVLLQPRPVVKEMPHKKLLVVSVTLNNLNPSTALAEKILSEMCEHSSDFSVDFVRQPGSSNTSHDEKWMAAVKRLLADKLSTASLKNYDGLVFLNTSGELPLPDVPGLIDWVKSGKAFIGIHAAADTLHSCKPYVEMLGGEFEGHAWNEPVRLVVEDRKHLAASMFRSRFDIEEEIYQFKNWRRDDTHVLISVDPSNDTKPKKADKPGETAKSFFERGVRADKDYAVSWVKEFGTGRVFYTGLGQSEEIWMTDQFQQHLLGGIRWALGDK